MKPWWHEGRQHRRIAEAHAEGAAAEYAAMDTAAQLARLSAVVHRRFQELEQRVEVLTEMLEASGIDRRVLELRLEARLDAVRAETAAPTQPCITCGNGTGLEDAVTPFGPVCAACDV